MMRAGASLTENRFFNNCGGKLFAKTGPILLDSNTRLWESDSFIDDNTLTVNMTRLRKKLEEAGMRDFVVTKKGLGYLIP